MNKTSRGLWIESPVFDGIFLLGPAWFASAFVLFTYLIARHRGDGLPEAGPFAWLFLVVAIDVSHVYSTAYRTYLDPEERSEQGALLIWIPIAAWVGGVILYSISALTFWRTLAYIAVFHFMRQQYGFLAIYHSREKTTARSAPRWEERLDTSTLYLSMLFPILYWHSHLPQPFHWFVRNDFVPDLPPVISTVFGFAFGACGLAWVFVSIRRFARTRKLSLPKILLIAGTALSWNLGIVLLASDFAFTVTNIVAHGVPYLALIWWNGKRTSRLHPDRKMAGKIRFADFYSPIGLFLFFGVLMGVAYLEEGIWDAGFWKEHASLFPWLGEYTPSTALATLLVPLLAVPQATHYILDGFVWKLRRPQGWQDNLH